MAELSGKEAVVALLQRAGLEVSGAAKVLDASLAGTSIAWEEIFGSAGTLGLIDQGCSQNNGCKPNEGCTINSGCKP
jgi:hypothetical protein